MAKQEEKVDVSQTSEEKKSPAKKAGKVAKVNMTLPSGTHLVIGEPVQLKAEDEAHLKKHFPDHLDQIVE